MYVCMYVCMVVNCSFICFVGGEIGHQLVRALLADTISP